MKTSLIVGNLVNFALAVVSGSRMCMAMSIGFGLAALVVMVADVVRSMRRV